MAASKIQARKVPGPCIAMPTLLAAQGLVSLHFEIRHCDGTKRVKTSARSTGVISSCNVPSRIWILRFQASAQDPIVCDWRAIRYRVSELCLCQQGVLLEELEWCG